MTLPTDYAGLTLWLDATQDSFSDGDPVGTWTDRSGNSRNFTGVTTARPTFKTNIFGSKPALMFDGNDVLSIAALSNTIVPKSASSTFAVFKAITFPTDATPVYNNGAILGDADGFFSLNIAGTTNGIGAYTHDPQFEVVQSAGIALDTMYVAHMRHDSVNLVVSLDGVETSTPCAARDGNNVAVEIGGSYSTFFINAYIAELFCYSAARSAPEVAALITYLDEKWSGAAATRPLPVRNRF